MMIVGNACVCVCVEWGAVGVVAIMYNSPLSCYIPLSLSTPYGGPDGTQPFICSLR